MQLESFILVIIYLDLLSDDSNAHLRGGSVRELRAEPSFAAKEKRSRLQGRGATHFIVRAESKSTCGKKSAMVVVDRSRRDDGLLT